jgi:hypothetical protein
MRLACVSVAVRQRRLHACQERARLKRERVVGESLVIQVNGEARMLLRERLTA